MYVSVVPGAPVPDVRSMWSTLAPSGPVAPVSPFAPVGPTALPASIGSPALRVIMRCPLPSISALVTLTPCGPVAPVSPVSPFAPFAPVSPLRPENAKANTLAVSGPLSSTFTLGVPVDSSTVAVASPNPAAAPGSPCGPVSPGSPGPLSCIQLTPSLLGAMPVTALRAIYDPP